MMSFPMFVRELRLIYSLMGVLITIILNNFANFINAIAVITASSIIKFMILRFASFGI